VENEEFKDRLRVALKGESVNSFAVRAGIRESLLRKYLVGSQPGLDKAVEIAKAANVNLIWLATGKGSPEDHMQESVFKGILKSWLEEKLRENPDYFIEFTVECSRKIDEFREWLNKRKTTMVSGHNQGQITK
jgi:hypothetical protein